MRWCRLFSLICARELTLRTNQVHQVTSFLAKCHLNMHQHYIRRWCVYMWFWYLSHWKHNIQMWAKRYGAFEGRMGKIQFSLGWRKHLNMVVSATTIYDMPLCTSYSILERRVAAIVSHRDWMTTQEERLMDLCVSKDTDSKQSSSLFATHVFKMHIYKCSACWLSCTPRRVSSRLAALYIDDDFLAENLITADQPRTAQTSLSSSWIEPGSAKQ